MTPRSPGPALALLFTVGFLLAALPATARGADAVSLKEAGIPAMDQTWGSLEYEIVLKVLRSEKIPLPVIGTPEGKAFIERITSNENLAFGKDAGLALDKRLPGVNGMLVGLVQVMSLYANAANAQHLKVNAELARMLAFELRVVATITGLMHQFMATLPKDDKNEARAAGLKKMSQGVGKVYLGATQSLSERSFYSAADLSLVVAAMAETLPANKSTLPPDVRPTLRSQLDLARTSFKGEDRKRIDAMLAELAE